MQGAPLRKAHVLVTNIRLSQKNIDKNKHASLFCKRGVKKFYNFYDCRIFSELASVLFFSSSRKLRAEFFISSSLFCFYLGKLFYNGGAGSTKANGREPRSCLGRVLNFKLGCFVVANVTALYILIPSLS